MTEREEFEKVYPMPEFMSWDDSDNDYFLSETPNNYGRYYNFAGAWSGWQAARAASPKVPQGVEEWIADNWWCPIHNDEECDCGTGFVPADALESYLSGMAIVPVEPTEAMLVAARDWSHKKYSKPIGNDAAQGCWQAMLAATKEKGE